MAKTSPAPLDSSMLGVAKGKATPAIEEFALAEDAPEGTAPPRKTPPPPAPPAAAVEEVRVSLTARVRLSTQERLRRVVFDTRRGKQDIVDEALCFWMDNLGY